MQTISIENELMVDVLTLKKAALVYRAINHKLRLQMLHLLNEHKELTVTAIYVKLRIEQSVASQHLAILRKAKIVSTKRDGKKIFYSNNEDRIAQIHQISRELLHNLSK